MLPPRPAECRADTSQAHSDYLLNTGDVGTGVYDFGGVTTFEILNSATVTDPAVAGQIAIDTTSDQFLLYGGAQRVITYKRVVGFTLEAPVAGDDNVPFFHAPYPLTITDVFCENLRRFLGGEPLLNVLDPEKLY